MKHIEEIQRFLDPAQCRPVRDPLWHHIHVPELFQRLLGQGAFIKIAGIRQLGPTHLVYPGATHTRLNHSLGVFEVAKRFLLRMLSEPAFRSSASVEGAKAFLCAALSHDIGHFPYTHSLKELPLKDHETLTAELLQEAPLATLLRDGGIDPGMVASIIDHGIEEKRPELLLYRSVLSGVLDPDKLDYLNRDAYFCGVPYGVQDLDFILGTLRVLPGLCIAIDQSGVASIEHLLFSKYLMYRAVYWHRQVRTATAMIKRALFLALGEGAIKAEELYHLDDARFTALAESRAPALPALQLVHRVGERRLLSTILELPYNEQAFGGLLDLARRHAAEQAIGDFLRARFGRSIDGWQVVIDVPESVSFEADIPVIGAQGVQGYLSSGTVFTAGVVRDFTASLRVLRVMAPIEPESLGAADRARLAEMARAEGSRA